MEATFDRDQRTAEFTVPSGCPLCSGELAVRLSPGHTYSYCAHCHWISRSHVAMSGDGIRVAHPPGGFS